MAHRLAVAIYDHLLGFEYGIAAEVFGLRRPNLGVEWYDFLPCRVEEGRLTNTHGLEFDPPGTLADLAAADTVLVPGWRRTLDCPQEPFLEALRAAHARGARMVSICTGAFALAYAGVLDGRQATTHWLYVEELKRRFPRVRVDPDALYIHDGRVSTSAGSAAGLDVCLAVIREDFGVAVANKVARRMVAPVHREGGQSQYAELVPQTSETNGFGPVLEWMTRHLEEDLRLEEVARKAGYTLRTFQRRFREHTGLSPHRWLSQQRVGRARELLETTDHNVDFIANRSGLGSAANLRKHFARHLSTTPRVYRSAFRAIESAG